MPSVNTICDHSIDPKEPHASKIDTFELVFSHSAIGMALVGPDGNWIKVNNALCNVVGYSREELLKKKFTELTFQEDLTRNQREVNKLKKGETDCFTIEKRYVHKSGKLIWVNINVAAVRDTNSNLIYMVTQVENISKRKEYESQIKEQILTLQKFKKAVESTSDLIVITDMDGNIVYVNHAIEPTTGYKKYEALGKKAGKLWGGLMPKEFYEELWHTIKVEKKSFTGKVKNKRKDNSEYYAEIKISPIFAEEGSLQFFVGIERDITKEVQVDQMKSEFISLASHQLKTPLSAIRWFSEMLLDQRLGDLNLRQKNCVDNIMMSNMRMMDIVNDLLNISKIEAGKLALDVKDLKLETVLNEVLNELSTESNRKNQKIHVNILDDAEYLKTDSNALKNILSNLVSNAIKYTPENGDVYIDALTKKSNILIRVRDTGMGISEEARPKIFSKFYRAQNAIDKNPEGTGLGLYTIKVIVNYLGGDIGFDSELGKGSTFWFTIPKSTKIKQGEFKVE